MTTRYYEPIEPITSLATEDTGGHIRLRVFLRGKLSGELVFGKDEIEDLHTVLNALADGNEIGHSYHGGIKRGICWHTSRAWREGVRTLINEYGELHDLAELRARYLF